MPVEQIQYMVCAENPDDSLPPSLDFLLSDEAKSLKWIFVGGKGKHTLVHTHLTHALALINKIASRRKYRLTLLYCLRGSRKDDHLLLASHSISKTPRISLAHVSLAISSPSQTTFFVILLSSPPSHPCQVN